MTQESPFELLLTQSRMQHRVPRRTLSPHPALQFRLLLAFSHLSHLTLAIAYCYPFWCLVCPECLDPFPLCPALLDSLDGRYSVE